MQLLVYIGVYHAGGPSCFTNLLNLFLQFEFGLAVLLLCPVVCSIMAFLLSLQAEEMVMTSKPRKVLITISIDMMRLQISFANTGN